MYRFSVIQAAAWKQIAELFRRHAATHGLKLLEQHPGISIRGQLRLLIDPPTTGACRPASITFNFGGPSGTCDIQVEGSASVTGLDFVSPMLQQDPIEIVDRLEGLLGLPRPGTLPPSTAPVLAVRTVSAVLSQDWLARTDLRATLGWVDTSGGCTVPEWIRVFGADLTGLAQEVNRGAMPWREAHAQTHRFVAIHEAADGGPMLDADRRFAALDLTDGVLILAGHDCLPRRITLAVEYKKGHRRLGPVVDDVLAHLGR